MILKKGRKTNNKVWTNWWLWCNKQRLSRRNFSWKKGRLSKLEKDYNELKLQYNKQSVEEVLIQRAVETTVQRIFDKGLFDKYAKADKVLADFLFTTRRRGDLSEQANVVIQWFCS